MFISFN